MISKIKNKFKDISIKNHMYYFFDDIINKKILFQIILKQMKSHTHNILIYYIGYVTMKDSKYVKINSLNPL